MVWGCFVKDRLGPLIQLSGRITGSIYIELLENNFLPFYNNFENFIFQDDNASVHKVRAVN